MGEDLSTPTIVFMYHALYQGEAERQAIAPEERPYSVERKVFARHLTFLRDAGVPLLHPQTLLEGTASGGGVVLTFDDGHASNLRHAQPELSAHGATGLFFLSTALMGKRDDFLSWSEVRELRAGGAVLGTHGRTHRFIDDLTRAEAIDELAGSRRELEQNIGAAVSQMSFPGGRYGRRELALAAEAGYRAAHTSELALHHAQASRASPLLTVPRVAVRAGTDLETFARMARADPWWLRRAQATARAKRAVRSLLGSALYHRLYARVRR